MRRRAALRAARARERRKKKERTFVGSGDALPYDRLVGGALAHHHVACGHRLEADRHGGHEGLRRRTGRRGRSRTGETEMHERGFDKARGRCVRAERRVRRKHDSSRARAGLLGCRGVGGVGGRGRLRAYPGCLERAQLLAPAAGSAELKDHVLHAPAGKYARAVAKGLDEGLRAGLRQRGTLSWRPLHLTPRRSRSTRSRLIGVGQVARREVFLVVGSRGDGGGADEHVDVGGVFLRAACGRRWEKISRTAGERSRQRLRLTKGAVLPSLPCDSPGPR